MKKTVSILLSVIMIVAVVTPAFAASTEKCDCGFNPIVYVAALGSASLTLDEGTENERTLFRPETDYIVEQALLTLSPSLPFLFQGNYDVFGDALIKFVNDCFGDLALDNEGNSSSRVTTDLNVPTDGVHGIDHSFYFNYDFRLDPYEHADRLHEVIQQIKELTGHEKVNMRASSMGGVVTMAYLERYGTEDIDTLIFQCCPIKGTAVAGELYNGKVMLNADALANYGLDAIPSLENDPLQAFLISLILGLKAAGALDYVIDHADDLLPALQDRVYAECLIPIFGTLPCIWSFVPDEYYDGAKELMVNPDTQSKLIEKIDNYHYNVMCNAEEILQSANNEINLYILCGYNVQRTPLVTAIMNTSDGTVDTKYASVGATCADYGETFDDDYTQAVVDGHNHISNDRMIDASTCALPEQTWFVKDMLHCTTHDGHGALYNWMFLSEEQQTVFSNAKYPQFLQNDIPNQTFEEVNNSTETEKFVAQPSFTNFVKMIYDFLTKLFAFLNL